MGKCPASTPEDVENAVAAAKKAFKTWSKTDIETRRQALRDIVGKMEANLEALATVLSKENGKPMKGFMDQGARFEIGGASRSPACPR